MGRQTIYRWWNNRGQIVLEALGYVSRTRVGRSRTGELPTDILQFVRDTVTHAKSVRTALAVVMIDAQQDPLFLNQFRSDFIEVRRHAFLESMNSDLENVRLSQTDQQFLADLIYGPLWYRLLIDHAPLDRHFADRLAQTALDWYARRSSDNAS